MYEAFLPLTNDILPYTVPFIAVFARMSVFVFLLPGIGETVIPVRVRLSIALVLTFLLLPVLNLSLETEPSIKTVTAMISLEALSGFLMGMILRLFVYALQILGNIVSQALSISQVLGEGIATEPNTTISTLFMMAGVTCLISLDLHVAAVGIFVRSYDVFAFGQGIEVGQAAHWMSTHSMAAFTLGVSLALPFIILNFIYNMMIGFLNRAMPQLMVSFVGMPAITGAGIVLLSLSAGTMLLYWLDAYQALSADVWGAP